jgi:Ca-activated chloride channel family protein
MPVTVVGGQIAAARAAPGYDPRAVPTPLYLQGRDRFSSVDQNPFKIVSSEPVSTFSIDVDTASYGWMRASLNRNVLPQPDSVRTEELVNYFPYDYARPDSAPAVQHHVDVFPSPWTKAASSCASASAATSRAARRGRAPTWCS